jgi:hypothetical protein
MEGGTPHVQIFNVHPGDFAYDAFLWELQQEPLRTEARVDADHEHYDGIRYTVVYDLMRGVERPAAWAGFVSTTIDGQPGLKCVNNYVRHSFRGGPIRYYDFAFHYRQQTILHTTGLPAETYLFPEPIPLHLAHGWITDTSPTGTGIHRPDNGPARTWQRLTWHPK